MNIFEQIIYGLSAKMETPQGYGAFHLISFGIIIALTAVVCLTLGKASQKAEKILLMTVWAVLILWEAYRQLVYAAHFEETVYWDYQWESFPFQFCSSPLFLLPLAALPKNEKLRDAVRMFLASFSLFAGLAVMFYPNGAFSSTIGVSVQTMLHHGSMIILGVYLGGRLLREGKMTIKRFLQADVMFAVMVVLALIMNLLSPLVTDETFNMFYIGPNFPCSLVILDAIYLNVPYVLFLMIYMLGFSAMAFLVFSGQLVLRPSWYKSLKRKKAEKNSAESYENTK